jgi:hypothetical protein
MQTAATNSDRGSMEKDLAKRRLDITCTRAPLKVGLYKLKNPVGFQPLCYEVRKTGFKPLLSQMQVVPPRRGAGAVLGGVRRRGAQHARVARAPPRRGPVPAAGRRRVRGGRRGGARPPHPLRGGAVQVVNPDDTHSLLEGTWLQPLSRQGHVTDTHRTVRTPPDKVKTGFKPLLSQMGQLVPPTSWRTRASSRSSWCGGSA